MTLGKKFSTLNLTLTLSLPLFKDLLQQNFTPSEYTLLISMAKVSLATPSQFMPADSLASSESLSTLTPLRLG